MPYACVGEGAEAGTTRMPGVCAALAFFLLLLEQLGKVKSQVIIGQHRFMDGRGRLRWSRDKAQAETVSRKYLSHVGA